MKALIIEDEKAAVRNLKALLKEVAPDTEVTEVLDSVTDSVAWFESNHAPDVVFMDIHLADGSSFEIFEHVRIDCPIIFTTAYDEYALRAFKVNSVDYLLKPIGATDLQRALDKFKTLHHTPDQSNALSALINACKSTNATRRISSSPTRATNCCRWRSTRYNTSISRMVSPKPSWDRMRVTYCQTLWTNLPTASIPTASSA